MGDPSAQSLVASETPVRHCRAMGRGVSPGLSATSDECIAAHRKALSNQPQPVMNLEGLDIGPYRPGEEQAILDCMRSCFRFEPDLHKWRHLYLDNPAGEPIIVLARHSGKVVGHVALSCRRIRAFGKDGLAGHATDAMTHPAWQRKGLFRVLTSIGCQQAQERGFVATYAVANEQSLHNHVKYGGRTPLHPFPPVMVRPVRPVRGALALAAELLRRAFATGPTIGHAMPPECATAGPLPGDPSFSSAAFPPRDDWTSPSFDERHTRLFSELEAPPPIAVIRDAAHLRWRYSSSPESPYVQRDIFTGQALAATVVIRFATLLGLRFVFVMEWLWQSGARREGLRLMREVVRFARSNGTHVVSALAMPGTLQRRLLQRVGFAGIPEFVHPWKATLTVGCGGGPGKVARWVDRSNWYYTWGDGFIF